MEALAGTGTKALARKHWRDASGHLQAFGYRVQPAQRAFENVSKSNIAPPMHILLIARVLGLFALLFAMTLTLPIGIALLHCEVDLLPFLVPLAGSLALGFLLWGVGALGPRLRGYSRSELGVRDGFLVVALFWFLLSALGAWPLMLGVGLSPVDALFESASGLTTTGATVISGLDALPRSLLFYRQELQWLGGMGVVVLGLAVIPLLGIGGMQLYRAEAPGPLKDEKLTPRLVGTARSLWLLYVLLTAACALGYWLVGMNAFDALAHSLSTVSTGGFSTHDASIGYYDSAAVEAVAIVFMLLAAMNFGLHFAIWRKRDLRLYLRDPEARAFLIFVFTVVLVVSLVLRLEAVYPSVLHGVREAAFTVVSLVTSTGFATVDHVHWPDFLPFTKKDTHFSWLRKRTPGYEKGWLRKRTPTFLPGYEKGHPLFFPLFLEPSNGHRHKAVGVVGP
jgi:trk system potassium uptake protein TrkH